MPPVMAAQRASIRAQHAPMRPAQARRQVDVAEVEEERSIFDVRSRRDEADHDRRNRGLLIELMQTQNALLVEIRDALTGRREQSSGPIDPIMDVDPAASMPEFPG